MGYTFTVEKVAINAVMAGCKPEYLPVVLGVSCTGLFEGQTSSQGRYIIVSGPIAKELGMNAGDGAFNPQNPPNATIGRAYEIMSRNLSGWQNNSNWMSVYFA
jgi:hypothetical protein